MSRVDRRGTQGLDRIVALRHLYPRISGWIILRSRMKYFNSPRTAMWAGCCPDAYNAGRKNKILLAIYTTEIKKETSQQHSYMIRSLTGQLAASNRPPKMQLADVWKSCRVATGRSVRCRTQRIPKITEAPKCFQSVYRRLRHGAIPVNSWEWNWTT